MEYTPNEINNLDYNEALEYDKRSCAIYYLSLLKKGHLFFFCFWGRKNRLQASQEYFRKTEIYTSALYKVFSKKKNDFFFRDYMCYLLVRG